MSSQPRKEKWDYPVAAIDAATRFRIPYTRVYNALPEIGRKAIETEKDLIDLVIHLQGKGVPFACLVKLFGAQMTLGQLAELEPELVEASEKSG